MYTVPSSASAFTALLPHFLLPRSTLSSSLVIIVLDWTRPWTFVEELETWLTAVETWAKGDNSREAVITREECRERRECSQTVVSSSNFNFIVPVQSHLQHYTEPSADPLPTANGALSSTLLPLGPGTLTHNSAGVPIIVVCTKADLIDEGNDVVAGASGMGSMVKGKGGEWEERTDGVMQVLRTICLKCKFSSCIIIGILTCITQMALLCFIQLLYLQRCRSCVSMHCICFSCPQLHHLEWLLRMKCRLLYAKYSLLHTSPIR